MSELDLSTYREFPLLPCTVPPSPTTITRYTVVFESQSIIDLQADLFDVICVNRYYGWYIDIGRLEQIEHSLYNVRNTFLFPYLQISVFSIIIYQDFITWKQRFGKAMLITEYGAESIPGLHKVPYPTRTVLFIFPSGSLIRLHRRVSD